MLTIAFGPRFLGLSVHSATFTESPHDSENAECEHHCPRYSVVPLALLRLLVKLIPIRPLLLASSDKDLGLVRSKIVRRHRRRNSVSLSSGNLRVAFRFAIYPQAPLEATAYCSLASTGAVSPGRKCNRTCRRVPTYPPPYRCLSNRQLKEVRRQWMKYSYVQLTAFQISKRGDRNDNPSRTYQCRGSLLCLSSPRFCVLPSSASLSCTLLVSACFAGSKTYIGNSNPTVLFTSTGKLRHTACGIGIKILVSCKYFSYSGHPVPFS